MRYVKLERRSSSRQPFRILVYSITKVILTMIGSAIIGISCKRLRTAVALPIIIEIEHTLA